MILQASLIGGWENLELWNHTHLALFALLIMVCVVEVILLKLTTSAGFFNRRHHYDPDYDEADEYEEDIYYEHPPTSYDMSDRRRIRDRSRHHEYQHQHQQEQELIYNVPLQYSYNSYNQPTDENNSIFDNDYRSTSTDVFRFVY